jgi:3,4-dihydroxy 2-butanone 4-phosphate synthase / GTP cyclohydrolase II
VVTADGLGMAGRDELERFANEHHLVMITVADLVRHRRRFEALIRRAAKARLPTRFGEFVCYAYESLIERETHLAFVMGNPDGRVPVLVRVHSECITGDIFASRRCDCGEQLEAAMERIAAVGVGVVVYLRGHEGRGVGIIDKLRAYELQDEGFDTVDANVELGLPIDSREYGIGAQILLDLGVRKMRLMTNNPAKRGGLEGFGLEILERVPLETRPNEDNITYLTTKRARLGHLLSDPSLIGPNDHVS